MSDVSEHSDSEFITHKKKKRRENIWHSVMALRPYAMTSGTVHVMT